MNIAVVIATLGRRAEAEDLLQDLRAQTRRPDQIAFVVVNAEDAPHENLGDDARVIISARKGLCAQRNVGVEHVRPAADIVVFFDDDFVPAPDFLQQTEALFAARPDLAGVTGVVAADGINGPGLSREEAEAAIADYVGAPFLGADHEAPRKGLYGCNMAFRASMMDGLRFDERLPLYGWLEDLDFSARIAQRGALIEHGRLAGAHRGVKRGRTSGVRLGYSQIANPLYLWGKGAPRDYLLSNMARNLAANHVRALKPEPYVDRLGRLKGNWMGLADALRRRLAPERVLKI